MAHIRERNFINDVLRKDTLIIESQERLENDIKIFTDREYAEKLAEEDFSEFGITKAEFLDIKKFVDNFKLFLSGAAHEVTDYRAILNKARIIKE